MFILESLGNFHLCNVLVVEEIEENLIFYNTDVTETEIIYDGHSFVRLCCHVDIM